MRLASLILILSLQGCAHTSCGFIMVADEDEEKPLEVCAGKGWCTVAGIKCEIEKEI